MRACTFLALLVQTSASEDIFTDDGLSLLQLRASEKSDEVLVLGQVTGEQGCRDLATQWGMKLGAIETLGYGPRFTAPYEAKGCFTYTGGPYACYAFYGTGGDEAAELAPPTGGGTAGPRSRLDATMQAQCAPNLAPGDDASATGDPHLTTNTGKHSDYTAGEKSDEVSLLGYPVGEGYGQVTSEQGCRDLATQWGMELGGGKFLFSGSYSNKGCYTYKSGFYACKAFYGTGGDEAAQLAPPSSGKSRFDTVTQAQCAPTWTPPGDEASATGDPHLTTNTGTHYDYTVDDDDKRRRRHHR